jgi:hypothetical protein
VPSSKPNQRSLKKMWPLISPPSGRADSFMRALISEWPVLYISGTPPAAADGRGQRCEHLTSKMMVPPGTRDSTSRANSMIWRSG